MVLIVTKTRSSDSNRQHLVTTIMKMEQLLQKPICTPIVQLLQNQIALHNTNFREELTHLNR